MVPDGEGSSNCPLHAAVHCVAVAALPPTGVTSATPIDCVPILNATFPAGRCPGNVVVIVTLNDATSLYCTDAGLTVSAEVIVCLPGGTRFMSTVVVALLQPV